MSEFIVKDSGERMVFDSGMQRDTTEGKINYALTADGPMLRRWAGHLTKGAGKYSPRNWMKAAGYAELERFRESAFRHFMLWYYGEQDEDHAAAVFFNINGAEYVGTPAKPADLRGENPSFVILDEIQMPDDYDYLNNRVEQLLRQNADLEFRLRKYEDVGGF